MNSYRPDIDGLRALAILPVMFFHAGFPGVSGGFIGVDVFFVISGFLITSILLREIDVGCFSILNFYDRRIRRIFPALFGTLLLTSLLAWFFLYPDELTIYGEALTATTFFLSNVYFWQEADYFARAAESRPLLHTWSLAVEEQYYIFFPLFLALVSRQGRNSAFICTAAFLVLSFLISVWGIHTKPVATFYLLPTRAWELLIGSLLAFRRLEPPQSPTLKTLLSALGLTLILAPVFAYTPATPFPGLAALAPCLGSALLIFVGSETSTPINKLLASRLLVGIGLISYSLYLFHWPVLVFARYALSVGHLSALQSTSAIAITFLLAFLSWRYIERPFRQRDTITQSRIFKLAGLTMALALVVGATGILTKGIPGRLSDDVLALVGAEHDKHDRARKCLNSPPRKVELENNCRIGASESGNPTFALWGDSHAASFLPALEEVALNNGTKGIFFGKSSCPPLSGVTRADLGATKSCPQWSDEVLKTLQANESIQIVYLVGRWGQYAEGDRYENESGAPTFIRDDTSTETSRKENKAVLARALERTVSALQAFQKEVVLVGPTPEIGINVPRSLASKSALDLARIFAPLLRHSRGDSRSHLTLLRPCRRI